MVKEVPNHKQFSFYDKFLIKLNLCPSAPVYTWMLIGSNNNACLQHYIADSDNKEELQVWADMHSITVES